MTMERPASDDASGKSRVPDAEAAPSTGSLYDTAAADAGDAHAGGGGADPSDGVREPAGSEPGALDPQPGDSVAEPPRAGQTSPLAEPVQAEDARPEPVEGGETGEAAEPLDLMSRLLRRFASLEASVSEDAERVLAAFEGKFRMDASREKVIDRLHGELQEHKAGLHESLLQPVLKDLVALHNNILKFARARRGYEQERRDWHELLDSFETFTEELCDTLARYGVDVHRSDNESFDPKTQRAVKTIPTHDPAEHKRVADRLLPGFRRDKKVIAHEQVVVFRYTPAADEPQEESEQAK